MKTFSTTNWKSTKRASAQARQRVYARRARRRRSRAAALPPVPRPLHRHRQPRSPRSRLTLQERLIQSKASLLDTSQISWIVCRRTSLQSRSRCDNSKKRCKCTSRIGSASFFCVIVAGLCPSIGCSLSHSTVSQCLTRGCVSEPAYASVFICVAMSQRALPDPRVRLRRSAFGKATKNFSKMKLFVSCSARFLSAQLVAVQGKSELAESNNRTAWPRQPTQKLSLIWLT